LFCSGDIRDRSAKSSEIAPKKNIFRPQIFFGGGPQISDLVFKMEPISDHHATGGPNKPAPFGYTDGCKQLPKLFILFWSWISLHRPNAYLFDYNRKDQYKNQFRTTWDSILYGLLPQHPQLLPLLYGCRRLWSWQKVLATSLTQSSLVTVSLVGAYL